VLVYTKNTHIDAMMLVSCSSLGRLVVASGTIHVIKIKACNSSYKWWNNWKKHFWAVCLPENPMYT